MTEWPERPRALIAYPYARTLNADASMVTSSLTGAFRSDPAARAEFMALTNGAT